MTGTKKKVQISEENGLVPTFISHTTKASYNLIRIIPLSVPEKIIRDGFYVVA